MNFIADYGLIFIFFIFPVMYALQPLFYPALNGKSDSAEEAEELVRRKQVLYRQIKELDMEREMGNVNEEDYLGSRQELIQEVSEIITRMNAEEKSAS